MSRAFLCVCEITKLLIVCARETLLVPPSLKSLNRVSLERVCIDGTFKIMFATDILGLFQDISLIMIDKILTTPNRDTTISSPSTSN